MAARRNPPLKLTPQVAAVPDVVDAAVGGLGLDWEQVPPVLDPAGRAAWTHLRQTFEESSPVRFREGDRAAVSAFCMSQSLHEKAAADLLAEGLQVQGRSSADRGRQVKSPAFQVWRDTGTQMRYWARELGLTPDSRGRSGIRDDDVPPAIENNPFAG